MQNQSPTPLTKETRNCIEFCRAEVFQCSILVTQTTKIQILWLKPSRTASDKKNSPNLFYRRSKLVNPIKTLTCALSNYAITHFTCQNLGMRIACLYWWSATSYCVRFELTNKVSAMWKIQSIASVSAKTGCFLTEDKGFCYQLSLYCHMQL